jgi:hypothetical protein
MATNGSRDRRNIMSQLKHCLMATAGLGLLITAVAARLNALNGDGISPLGSVHALFDLSAPVNDPFPSDWFTVADISHNSGRRISLPLPDCETRRSAQTSRTPSTGNPNSN